MIYARNATYWLAKRTLIVALLILIAAPVLADPVNLACRNELLDLNPIHLVVDPEARTFTKVGTYGLKVVKWAFGSVKVTETHVEAFLPDSESQQAQRWLINRITGSAQLEVGKSPVGLFQPFICEVVQRKF